MNRTDIIHKINSFLVEEFEADPESISGEANFHETLDLDSLDYVDLVVLVDEAFGFKMQGDDFKSIATYNDFYDFIELKTKQKQTA